MSAASAALSCSPGHDAAPRPWPRQALLPTAPALRLHQFFLLRAGSVRLRHCCCCWRLSLAAVHDGRWPHLLACDALRSPRPCHSGLVHLETRVGGSTARSEECCCISTRGVPLSSLRPRAADVAELCAQVALGYLLSRQHPSAASWAAWRAASCHCCLPSRVSLASLLFYSSLVSCAASWATGRVSLASLLFYSSLVSCASS